MFKNLNLKNKKELYKKMLDPVWFGRLLLKNRDGSKRDYWPHQKIDLRSQSKAIIHLDGRDVGKSISLSTIALHFAFINQGGKCLIASPQQGHLDNVIEEIEFQIENNPHLLESIAITKGGKPKIIKKPYFRIEFKNGSVLYFRPAGAYGDSFRSLHVGLILVDEAAWLSEKAWRSLRQCLVSNGKTRIYSTPNGLRNTTYYRLTLSEKYTVFKWPSWLNPGWTKEREADLLEFYGGKETSGWSHEVAGIHGKPSYGAFNIEQFNLCRQEIIEYQKIIIRGNSLKGCNSEDEIFDRLEMLLNLVPQTGIFYIGADTGYTNDPSEIVVFREDQIGDRKVLKLILRIHAEHVPYPHISQIIGLLDQYFLPVTIGIDNGGNGISIIQELLSLDKYRDLDLKDRIHGINFGGITRLFAPDGREMKKRTKELMTSLINRAFQRKELILPIQDQDIEEEFTTHTYTLRNGMVIYSKGLDHIIDSIRCVMLVREQFLENESGAVVNIPNLILTAPIFV